MKHPSSTTARVLEMAAEEGFDLAGIAPLQPPPDADRFERWLEAGHHAGMEWLERNRARITDPGQLLSGRPSSGRPGSILALGLGHSRGGLTGADGGRVARYAAGRDYHNVMGRMLRRLLRRLVEGGLVAQDERTRRVVDAGPLLERSHAARAGLGFVSKAANLLHPRFGPWFFLGEILLPLELDPTGTPPAGSCGTCTACIDACPTGAILNPGQVDAGRCISYQTIENRGHVPRELRGSTGPWAFGCDVCSEVCPWGDDAADLSARYGDHRLLAEGGLVRWLSLRDEDEWDELTLGSPLRRPGRAGLARNAAIVLGNRPSDEGRGALLQALDRDSSALVREASAWALAAGHGEDDGAREAVERAAAREPDPAARAEMLLSLEGP